MKVSLEVCDRCGQAGCVSSWQTSFYTTMGDRIVSYSFCSRCSNELEHHIIKWSGQNLRRDHNLIGYKVTVDATTLPFRYQPASFNPLDHEQSK